uniref:Uncharacterized protein LOC102804171 n=1 Tax=Saccoglossus kowalevskii TaxID=10224 RepID=A0ABM0M9Q7_SACKO|nr:PREDICTED: uncharacterized protein LOC102804171 [Saccoglossus kowalevskii]
MLFRGRSSERAVISKLKIKEFSLLSLENLPVGSLCELMGTEQVERLRIGRSVIAVNGLLEQKKYKAAGKILKQTENLLPLGGAIYWWLRQRKLNMQIYICANIMTREVDPEEIDILSTQISDGMNSFYGQQYDDLLEMDYVMPPDVNFELPAPTLSSVASLRRLVRQEKPRFGKAAGVSRHRSVSLHTAHERERHKTVNQAILYLMRTLPSAEKKSHETKFMVLNRAVEYIDFLRRKIQEKCSQSSNSVQFLDNYLCIPNMPDGNSAKTSGSGMKTISPEILKELTNNAGNMKGDLIVKKKNSTCINQFSEEQETTKTNATYLSTNIKKEDCGDSTGTQAMESHSPWHDHFKFNSFSLSPLSENNPSVSSRSSPDRPMFLSPVIDSSEQSSIPDSSPSVSTDGSSEFNYKGHADSFPFEHTYSVRFSGNLTSEENVAKLCSKLKSPSRTAPGDKLITPPICGTHKLTASKKNRISARRSFGYDKPNQDCKHSNCGLCTPADVEIPGPENDIETNFPPPKSWINGYQLYTRMHYQDYKMDHPNLIGREVTKVLGNAWRELPEEERKVYSQRACELNEKTRREREALLEEQSN